MRVFGVMRGFPGLGRVVAGLALLDTLRRDYGADVQVYTYMQGISACHALGFQNFCNGSPTQAEVTSLGLDISGPTVAKIVDHIMTWQPDMVLVDGEPLLINLLALCYEKSKVVSLLNPSDLFNELPYATKTLFRFSLLNGGLAIVHGLPPLPPKGDLPEYVLCINTVLRNGILSLPAVGKKPFARVSCILGGGSQGPSPAFRHATLQIAKAVMAAAAQLPHLAFRLFCNDAMLIPQMMMWQHTDNVTVAQDFGREEELYRDCDLVICRAGRNTVSEALFLDIPCILFAAGNDYRTAEQRRNIEGVTKAFPSGCFVCDSKEGEDLADTIRRIERGNRPQNGFVPGNQAALQAMLRLYHSNCSTTVKYDFS